METRAILPFTRAEMQSLRDCVRCQIVARAQGRDVPAFIERPGLAGDLEALNARLTRELERLEARGPVTRAA